MLKLTGSSAHRNSTLGSFAQKWTNATKKIGRDFNYFKKL